MMLVLGFVLGSALGVLLGYAICIVLVSGWSFSNAVLFGLHRALRAKNLAAFYETTARFEREMYALHFWQALYEIGGPGAHLPKDTTSLRAIYKIAEERTKFSKKRKAAFFPWNDEELT